MAADSVPVQSDRCTAFANDERIVLAGLLMEAHDRLIRTLSNDLEEQAGLSLSWYEVMVHLRRSSQGRMAMGELANEIVLSSGGVTRLIDRIEEAGLVARVACPTDRRTTYVVLTERGHDTLERTSETYLSLLDQHLMAKTTPTEREGLEAGLKRLLDR